MWDYILPMQLPGYTVGTYFGIAYPKMDARFVVLSAYVDPAAKRQGLVPLVPEVRYIGQRSYKFWRNHI